MYDILMYAHLATVVPCIFLGAYVLAAKKGTAVHKRVGGIYMVLMIVTSLITLFMPAKVGARFLGHFGFIHLFSLLTIYTVPAAILAIRRGNVASHKRKMIILYVAAIGITGAFTLFPGRFLHTLFFA